MSFKSPLNKAVGLGSAKHGFGHWWMQRLSAVALIPLCIWFVWSLLCLASADYAAVVEWFMIYGIKFASVLMAVISVVSIFRIGA